MSAKIKREISATATLRSMKQGQSLNVRTRQIKTSIARATASKLKEEGYEFKITEAGLVDEFFIECVTSPNH